MPTPTPIRQSHEYTRRRLLALIVVPALLALAGLAGADESSASPARAATRTRQTDVNARAFHERALVIDAHADSLLRVAEAEELCVRSNSGHLDFPRMKEGGLDAQFFSVFVHPSEPKPAARAEELIRALGAAVSSCPEQAALARSAADVQRLRVQGRRAALIGLEGGHIIEGDIRNLRRFKNLGASYMTLTWSNTNEFADSCAGPRRWNGLNDLGREVVVEMNRLGMIVDVSHASDEAFWETIRITRKPVIASHSCCRAIHPHPRNLSDEMLRAIARNGGVVCINFYPLFLGSPEPRKGEKPDPVPLSLLIDHIEHAVKIAGVDHVGLGSDFDGIDATPEGMEDVARLPRITEELLKRGVTPEDVEKILGGNLLRVLRQVTGR